MTFEVPDEWWVEARVAGFVPGSRAYPTDTALFSGQNLREVSLADIKPIERQLSHGVFNHDLWDNVNAKDRVIRILMGFTAGDLVPPVVVAPTTASGAFRFDLRAGAHRFYLSIAVGYTHIPAVDEFDLGPPAVRVTAAK